jgi:general secretion pathway protein L
MSPTASFLNWNSLSASISRRWARLLAWYGHELQIVAPPRLIVWLLDRGDHELLLRAGEKELEFVDGVSGLAPISANELMGSSLEEALAARKIRRETVKIALEIERTAFLVRRFDVPAAATTNISKILVMEIERKTPLRSSDVVFGHICSSHQENPEKTCVELWILRKDKMERTLEGTGLRWEDIAVVRPERGPGQIHQPSIELTERPTPIDIVHCAIFGLAALTALLFIIGVSSALWRRDQIGAELDSRISEASARATRVRKTADQATAEGRLLATLYQERRTTAFFQDLLEEASRILPDGVYVTEFRLLRDAKSEDQVIELVGLADSAVGLPALFEKSEIFSEAALTAPITPDAREKREAFSLRAKVRRKAGAAQQ